MNSNAHLSLIFVPISLAAECLCGDLRFVQTCFSLGGLTNLISFCVFTYVTFVTLQLLQILLHRFLTLVGPSL